MSRSRESQSASPSAERSTVSPLVPGRGSRAAADELEVRGDELLLRYARPEDAPALFALASDAEVTRFFSWGPYRNESEAASYIASVAAKRAQGSMLEFVIVNADAGVIGVTGLSEFSLRDRRAVVGTWHGREWWGKGANRRSKALVLALAFRGLGLERVTAWCGTDNARSQRALERLGFVHEGVLRSWHVHGGEPKDVIAYGMLKTDWIETGLAAEPIEIVGHVPAQFLPNA
jgi:[ribosomal protein S5]-alanine N-acetyltransferase